ncbi:class I SAM-dependent methyltransferase [Actinomycetospora soli]|uniref:class I SAM-dependent methyltransferase n=1 Tax=Actinomycetospora soli TaxID=2893887 RepID=UPI001E358B80|nr:class I SAM-dependent methyltransferase [Actinomycetospora soli]MCD2188388.1 class I SAM-dependent methyltransferase [Actinomycetospora soli]
MDAQAVTARHRAVWASGDYPRIARDVVAPLGPVLVEACRIGPHHGVLDVAAGAGNAARPAARTGATVVASDLVPDLLAVGRAEAEAEGLTLQWEEADAAALPFEDADFDVVMSCIGVMFAPDHRRCADELLRTCRPGGRIGLLSWTPEGFVGRMFATMRPYAPAPPPGAQPPVLWGSEQHLQDLLGAGVTDVVAQRRTLRVERFADGDAFRDYFRAHYGPTIGVYASLVDDPDRAAALDRDLARLGDEALADGIMEWEYLLWTATRAQPSESSQSA